MDDDWARRHAHRDGSESSDEGAEKASHSKDHRVETLMLVFGDMCNEADPPFSLTDNEWAQETWERNPGMAEKLDYFRRRCGTCRDDFLVEWRLRPAWEQTADYLGGVEGAKPRYLQRDGGNLNFLTDKGLEFYIGAVRRRIEDRHRGT